MKPLEVMATLWPDMPHYRDFAKDDRLSGIRLNTTGRTVERMADDLKQALDAGDVPLYFDVKGRQLRVTQVADRQDRLELTLNHPISVNTPTPVIFKAGNDAALLETVEDDGYTLLFKGGPQYLVRPGESLHIRDPTLEVHGPVFTDDQIKFLEIAKQHGISRYMLSYVGSMDEIAQMRKYVGNAEIIAKIEDGKGLRFTQREYAKQPNLGLLAARGDLYVEVKKPHHILEATKKIIRADPDAIAGSRILLSLGKESVPSCADINEIAWLIDQGYHRYMFCDDLCFKPKALDQAINVLHAVYNEYGALAESEAAYGMPNTLKTPTKKWFSLK